MQKRRPGRFVHNRTQPLKRSSTHLTMICQRSLRLPRREYHSADRLLKTVPARHPRFLHLKNLTLKSCNHRQKMPLHLYFQQNASLPKKPKACRVTRHSIHYTSRTSSIQNYCPPSNNTAPPFTSKNA